MDEDLDCLGDVEARHHGTLDDDLPRDDLFCTHDEGPSSSPNSTAVLDKIRAAQKVLVHFIHSLQRPVRELPVVFATDHEALMVQNHRRRLAEWMCMYRNTYASLTSEFKVAQHIVEEEKAKQAAKEENGENQEAVEALAGTGTVATQLSHFSRLPAEVQILIFFYLTQPPPCYHFYKAVVWHHKMLDTATKTNTEAGTMLFANHPAIELMPDGALWTLCRASRYAMHRAYDRWAHDMAAGPYCSHKEGSDWDLDSKPVWEGGGRCRAFPSTYRCSNNVQYSDGFVRWRNADGYLYTETEVTADDEDEGEDMASEDEAAAVDTATVNVNPLYWIREVYGSQNYTWLQMKLGIPKQHDTTMTRADDAEDADAEDNGDEDGDDDDTDQDWNQNQNINIDNVVQAGNNVDAVDTEDHNMSTTNSDSDFVSNAAATTPRRRRFDRKYTFNRTGTWSRDRNRNGVVDYNYDSDPDTDNDRDYLQVTSPNSDSDSDSNVASEDSGSEGKPHRYVYHHMARFIEECRDAQQWILGIDGPDRRGLMYRSINHTYLTDQERYQLFNLRELFKKI